MTKELLEHISSLTAVPVGVCRQLLEIGWTYVERIDGHPTWEKIGR